MGSLMDELSNVFICDECDTLATVSVDSDTLIVNPCQCTTLEWNE